MNPLNINIYLWEILVPTVHNNGKPFRTRFHKVWDSKVRKITGGLSIFPPIKGHWLNPEGKLFTERMIPVRIMCSEDQLNKIADMTAQYYEQEAIMFYRLSDRVQIIQYEKNKRV
jgi:hypothetical protein